MALTVQLSVITLAEEEGATGLCLRSGSSTNRKVGDLVSGSGCMLKCPVATKTQIAIEVGLP